jgi:acyl carrier protein
MNNASHTPNLALVSELIPLITDAVNLQHLDKSTLNADTLLTQGGLGLDSVDILEVVVTVEHHYGIKIENAEQGKEVFKSFGTIAEYVAEKLKKTS